MIAHALREWPNEACGLVVQQSPAHPVRYLPCVNVSSNPRDYFEIADSVVLPFLQSGTLHGVFHSHPQGELSPSLADMRAQLDMQVPFYVCTLSPAGTYMDFWGWGDQLPTPPLKQREFRAGVTDCYSLARHFHHRVLGNVLPDFPRDDAWWDDPSRENPILVHMAASGFMPYHGADLQVGDGLLFRLRYNRVTHCGVYIGGGLFLHHMHGKISKADPLVQWGRFLHSVMRHKGDA